MNSQHSEAEGSRVAAHAHEAQTVPVDMQAAVRRVVQWYEQLGPDTLDSLHTCYTSHAHFKDPFNDVYGVAEIRQIFAHMFDTVDEPRFTVTDQVVQGRQAFLTWEFKFRMRRWWAGQPQSISGVSLLRFDETGLVYAHRDYWDAAQELYEKLPVLGVLMRWLRRAASASSATPTR